jgi:benzoate/toluate 1,2-dioxygenase subunit alpha
MGSMKDSASWVQDGGGEGRFTVSRKVFTDDAVFEREMQRIFEGGWVYLAHESQLPEAHDYVTVRVGRKSVIVARGADGEVRAFLNACPHRGAALCRTERGNKRVIVCPYHGWSFDSSGQNRFIKARETGGYAAAFDEASHDLRALPRVQSHRGFVFGSLTAEVPPLTAYLGAAAGFIDLLADQSPEGLEVIAGSAAYRYRGNWKLQVENGVDGYHFTTVHQNYVRVLQQRGARAQESGVQDSVRTGFDHRNWGKEAGWYDLGEGHTLLWLLSTAPSDRPLWEQREALAARVGEVRARWMVERQRNLSLFPNVQLMDQNSTQIRVIVPLAPDLTEVRSYCFAPRGEPAAARERRLRQFEDFFNASGFATPDDLSVFEGVQSGCESGPHIRHGYDRGMQRRHGGADEEARALGIEPAASGSDAQDELIYHGFYRRWAAAMTEGER